MRISISFNTYFFDTITDTNIIDTVNIVLFESNYSTNYTSSSDSIPRNYHSEIKKVVNSLASSEKQNGKRIKSVHLMVKGNCGIALQKSERVLRCNNDRNDLVTRIKCHQFIFNKYLSNDSVPIIVSVFG